MKPSGVFLKLSISVFCWTYSTLSSLICLQLTYSCVVENAPIPQSYHCGHGVTAFVSQSVDQLLDLSLDNITAVSVFASNLKEDLVTSNSWTITEAVTLKIYVYISVFLTLKWIMSDSDLRLKTGCNLIWHTVGSLVYCEKTESE